MACLEPVSEPSAAKRMGLTSTLQQLVYFDLNLTARRSKKRIVTIVWPRRRKRADLLIHQLNAEDAGGLGSPFTERPLGPFLDQPGLDGPVHVVGVQGSNGLHCLLGRAHAEAWGVHGGPRGGWGGPAGGYSFCGFCQADRDRQPCWEFV